MSRYDRVSAMLVALVILFGFLALLLFVIWLTKVITIKPRVPKVIPIQELRGRGEHAEGTARDMEEPGVEELPDVTDPQLSDALEAMTDAISTQKATLEQYEGNADQMGKGKGLGDSRAAGPGGEGDLDVVPPWQRWQIKYTTTSAEDYAKQLDFFQVELGAISRTTPNIMYARNLSSSRPARRSGTRDEEPRLYFVHSQKDPLLELTRALLAKANINTEGRLLAQFYPDAAYQQLLQIEKQSLGSRSLAKVRRTIFGVRSAGNGYEFYVIRHEFLPGA